MTRYNVIVEIDQRVKELTREYNKIAPEDPRRAEMENEISALYFEQQNVKNGKNGT